MKFTNLERAATFFPVWVWRTECDRPASLRIQKGPEVTVGEIGAKVDGLWWHADDQLKLVIQRGYPNGFDGLISRRCVDEYSPWENDGGLVRELIDLIPLPSANKLPPFVTEQIK